MTAPLAISFLPKHKTAVSFPDVGQGDCALIELPSGKTVLIDGGGTRDNRFDIGRRVLAPYLWSRGVRRLDLVVLSHPHPDHMNGLLFVLKKFDVAEVWDSGLDRDLPGYDAFRQAIEEKKTVRRDVSADGPPIMLGDAEFRVLHPSRAFIAHDRRNYAAENDRSLVVKVLSEGKIFLFTGDIGTEAEKTIMRPAQDVRCDLLKVPHHGSRSSSSDAFVSLTRPEVAVVTVGRGNPYRHPSDEVIARYKKIGTRICRTDQDGAVTVHVKNGRLETTRWNELLMERVDLRDRDAWGKKERTNWGRLRIRATAF